MPELPQAPSWEQAAYAKTMQEWVMRHFIPAEGLPGYLVCLKCACPVLDGNTGRHWDALHQLRGF